MIVLKRIQGRHTIKIAFCFWDDPKSIFNNGCSIDVSMDDIHYIVIKLYPFAAERMHRGMSAKLKNRAREWCKKHWTSTANCVTAVKNTFSKAYFKNLRQPIALFDTEQTRINTKLAFIDSARFEENVNVLLNELFAWQSWTKWRRWITTSG